MNIIFIIIFCLFYFIFITSFAIKNKNIFMFLFVLIIFFYDYVFISISENLDSIVFFAIKSWQEYLFFFSVLLIVVKTKIKGTLTYSDFDRNILFILLFLTIYGFFI